MDSSMSQSGEPGNPEDRPEVAKHIAELASQIAALEQELALVKGIIYQQRTPCQQCAVKDLSIAQLQMAISAYESSSTSARPSGMPYGFGRPEDVRPKYPFSRPLLGPEQGSPAAQLRNSYPGHGFHGNEAIPRHFPGHL